MNILFLAHRIPFPPDKGDKIRSYHEIKYLSGKHNVYLGTILDEESDKRHVPNLRKYCKDVYAVFFNKKVRLVKNIFLGRSFSVSSFYSPELQTYVDHVLNDVKIDVIICFCSSMAEYVFKASMFTRGFDHAPRLIMDFVDLDSDKWLQYSKYSRWLWRLIYRIESMRLFAYEKKINRYFHHSVFVAKREVNIFRKMAGETKNVHEISNGVDLDYFSFDLSVGENSEIGKPEDLFLIVFTGIMDYFANEDGVKWFCERIFPLIKKRISNVEFYIVGNRPTNVVWNLSEMDGVTVTGYVDDIRDYYARADICVAPLRIARGLQNKVLEAMATGNAVVATSNASEGICCHAGEDIIVADDTFGFAEAVIELLLNEDKRKKLGENARQNIQRNYSWDANLSEFDKLFL